MIGQTISHYNILEKLGQGGMGVVYKALDTKLDRTVALKFLPPLLSINKEEKKRFIHEAKAAAALDHPNICTIHEIGETEDGQMYIAMGFYEGQNLKDKINQRPLPLDETLDFAIQIAEGLSKAHKKEIVHRDIKSANIVVTEEGKIKILDFGLAKLKGATKLTKEGTTLGTVAYMSPEQTSGEEVDLRSDIWSLGVVLYEMITGQLPFKGEYEQAVMYSIMNEEPQPVTALRSGVSLELERIANKLLAKDPAQRFQSCTDLIVDLRNSFEKTGKLNRKPGFTTEKEKLIPGKRRLKWLGLALPVIAAAAALIFIVSRSGSDISVPVKQPAGEMQSIKWKNSIAVLPFTDLSAQKDQGYFCDGMTDDIISRLSHIRELKVIARTSVFHYKNSQKDLVEIGKELGVDTLLEGSIQKDKNRIKINVQLINAKDRSHLWADSFNDSMKSLFDLQDRVSASIAEALETKFSKASENQIRKNHPINTDAYEYYLQGMHYIKAKYSVTLYDKDFQTSVKMFSRAIDIDKNYALAYAGLAWAYYLHLTNTGAEDELIRFNKNMNMAYQLDPDSAHTNAGKGMNCIFNHQYKEANEFFRKALRLNPNLAEVHQMIGFSFQYREFFHKAQKYLRKAIELDPFWIWSRSHLASCLSALGKFNEAAGYFEKNIELDPNDRRHFCYYAVQFMKLGKLKKAEKLLKKAEKITDQSNQAPFANMQYYQALLQAVKGEREKAFGLYNKPDEYIYALLGMREEAIRHLSSQTEKRKNSCYLDLLHNPFYASLRGDPRFIKILSKEKQKYSNLLKILYDL